MTVQFDYYGIIVKFIIFEIFMNETEFMCHFIQKPTMKIDKCIICLS